MTPEARAAFERQLELEPDLLEKLPFGLDDWPRKPEG